MLKAKKSDASSRDSDPDSDSDTESTCPDSSGSCWSTCSESDLESTTLDPFSEHDDGHSSAKKNSENHILMGYFKGTLGPDSRHIVCPSAHSEPQSRQGGTPSQSPLQQQNSGTRKRAKNSRQPEGDSDDELEKDDDGSRDPKKPRFDESSSDTKRTLACPYFLRNPMKKSRSKQCVTGSSNVP
jgi:hypothetical protein